MIRIKTTNPGFDPSGAHWYMGAEHMQSISRKTASALCGMYPLPAMGCEIVAAIALDKTFPSVRHRLMVQNVSGSFWVASSSVRVDQWPDVFKVEVKK